MKIDYSIQFVLLSLTLQTTGSITDSVDNTLSSNHSLQVSIKTRPGNFLGITTLSQSMGEVQHREQVSFKSQLYNLFNGELTVLNWEAKNMQTNIQYKNF